MASNQNKPAEADKTNDTPATGLGEALRAPDVRADGLTAEQAAAATAPAPDGPPVPSQQAGLNVTRKVKDEDKDGHQDPVGPRKTVGVYHILVERSNNEKISSEALAHEIPILYALHGEDHVTFPGYDVDTDVSDVEPIYEVEIDDDPQSILDTLRLKFNNKSDGDVVMRVYRDADELASKAGFTKRKGKAKVRPQSDNTDARRKAR